MDKHEDFMRLALEEAGLALAAGEFPVGCVFVRHGEVVARGRRTNSRPGLANEMDHAEIAGLRSLLAKRPAVDPGEVTVYSTMEPCLMCHVTLLLNGIRKIVYAYEDVMTGGTGLELKNLPPLFRQMEVEIVPSVLRRESLALFQRFFASRDSSYWQGSLLAEYTLTRADRQEERAEGEE